MQSNLCHFPGQNLQGFSSYIFMNFFLNILNKEKLGVLLFWLFLIKFDQGVFVPRCCYHDSHAFCVLRRIENLGLEIFQNWGFC